MSCEYTHVFETFYAVIELRTVVVTVFCRIGHIRFRTLRTIEQRGVHAYHNGSVHADIGKIFPEPFYNTCGYVAFECVFAFGVCKLDIVEHDIMYFTDIE